ncbi:MAG: DEAD/DEAH box helicase [Phycisphaerales bacterium]|nr:DEAD/DEAH box helicase [Phycisphaerales bacterium]
MTSFAELNLSHQLLRTLAAEGYTSQTPIQAQAIPPILDGHDLLGCAQTGTGKTAAFLLPLIEILAARPGATHGRGRRSPRALILAPTRELAAQIEESLYTYGREARLRHAVIYGGVKQHHQVRQLHAGVDVIVATPGRLQDLMAQGYVDLSSIEVFILDEADRMLDMGFIKPIQQIAAELPADRQTLLFSATMPANIRKLANALLHEPVSVSVTPTTAAATTIDQELYHVSDDRKSALLTHLLQDARIVRTVVFTRTKHGAERLAKRLLNAGIATDTIHGNKSQSQRERSLHAFRSGRSRVLVATDVAARGLDVDGITHVFNFNLPNEPDAYVHRIGRTGRAGAAGKAISFCDRSERSFLRAIEHRTGITIPTSVVPNDLGTRAERPVPQPQPVDEAPEPRTEAPRPPRQVKRAAQRPKVRATNRPASKRPRRKTSSAKSFAASRQPGRGATRLAARSA